MSNKVDKIAVFYEERGISLQQNISSWLRIYLEQIFMLFIKANWQGLKVYLEQIFMLFIKANWQGLKVYLEQIFMLFIKTNW